MKAALALLLAALASCASLPGAEPATRQGSTAPSAAPRANQIAFYLGMRSLDEDLYAPLEDQAVFAIEYARETPAAPFGFEVGLAGSYDDATLAGTTVEASTGELYAGIRKSIPTGSLVRPLLGAGLALIRAELEVAGFGALDDSSLAAYAHAGLNFDLSEAFFLGLDLRGLFGSDITLAGFDGDADYLQLALVFGFGF